MKTQKIDLGDLIGPGQVWRDKSGDKTLPGGNKRTIKILEVHVDSVHAQVLTTVKGTLRKETPGGNVTTLLIATLRAGYVRVDPAP